MIILIAGASHTGKTALSQKLLEKHSYPYFSIDHLKMGLIRSGNTDLTPMDDERLTDHLWPIVREMIKTAIENGQNLIVEGCYIPFDWQKDFAQEYLENIRFVCLIFSKAYIEKHFHDIVRYGNVIEKRLYDSDLTKEDLIRDNEENLAMCKRYNCPFLLMEKDYDLDVIVEELERTGV